MQTSSTNSEHISYASILVILVMLFCLCRGLGSREKSSRYASPSIVYGCVCLSANPLIGPAIPSKRGRRRAAGCRDEHISFGNVLVVATHWLWQHISYGHRSGNPIEEGGVEQPGLGTNMCRNADATVCDAWPQACATEQGRTVRSFFVINMLVTATHHSYCNISVMAAC